MECETQRQKLLRDGKQEIGHDSGRDWDQQPRQERKLDQSNQIFDQRSFSILVNHLQMLDVIVSNHLWEAGVSKHCLK
jgi:hypothetical protein